MQDNMIKSLIYLFLLTSLSHSSSTSFEIGSGIGQKDKIEETKFATQDDLVGFDSFFDPKVDYSLFRGRVSDRDATSNILKVRSDNKNTKFFRTGDRLYFTVLSRSTRDNCEAFIRSVEEGYFVIYVKDINLCWDSNDYFRRGSLLSFTSPQLETRIKEASLHRVLLLKRRKNFFKQLNSINHFVWSYDQKKVILAADYDKKMVEIQKQKQKAIDFLLLKKRDKIRLQKELAFKLDELDKDLGFYRIEKDELYMDRWNTDQDLGLPVSKRPHKLKARHGDK